MIRLPNVMIRKITNKDYKQRERHSTDVIREVKHIQYTVLKRSFYYYSPLLCTVKSFSLKFSITNQDSSEGNGRV